MKQSSSFRRKGKWDKHSSKRSSRLTSIKKKQKKAAILVKREAEALLKKQKKKRLKLLKISSAPEAISQNDCTPTEDEEVVKLKVEAVPEKDATLITDTFESNISNTSIVISKKQTYLKNDCIVFSASCSISTVIIGLKPTSELIPFHGCAKVTLIKGMCTINGFRLCIGCTYNACAPTTHPAMVLQPIGGSAENDFEIYLTSLGISMDSGTIQSMKDHASLVVFQSGSDEFGPFPFPGYPDLYKVKESHCSSPEDLCTGCWMVSTDRHFQVHGCYQSALEKVLSYRDNIDISRSCLHKYPVTVAAGGKNTGKSTFNRYLVNNLLERYNKVYYLDCDIGQTEFTPSGFISLHTITKDTPILGPPFTHQVIPNYACYYGNNNAAGDPDRYVECIRFVLDSFLCDVNRDLDGPLVVNTMGWVRALGFHLLVDIIRMVYPTHLLQFKSHSESQKCELLVPSYVATASGWMSSPKKELQEYEHIELDVVTAHAELEQYRAPDHRDFALLSCLVTISQRCMERKCTPRKGNIDIRSVQPYVVKVSDLVICNATDSPIRYKYVMAALNASIVALCVVPEEMATALKNPYPETNLHAPLVCPCLGLGLVRGVDALTNTAYIISDLLPSEIANVNCLICGHLVVPDSMILTQAEKKNLNLPYVTNRYPYETIGAGAFKVHRKFQQLSNRDHSV